MTKKWKVVLLIFFSVILILVAASAFLKMQTKKHSPVDTITYKKGDLNINMVYYRPFKKGRVIFGKAEDGALQPFGTYWRLGANDATTIALNRDVVFAGKPLSQGKYSVYAYPGEKEWKIGVNSNANRWGISEPDHENDVLTVMVPVTYSDEIIEQLKITLEDTDQGAVMVIKWDTSVVRVPIN